MRACSWCQNGKNMDAFFQKRDPFVVFLQFPFLFSQFFFFLISRGLVFCYCSFRFLVFESYFSIFFLTFFFVSLLLVLQFLVPPLFAFVPVFVFGLSLFLSQFLVRVFVSDLVFSFVSVSRLAFVSPFILVFVCFHFCLNHLFIVVLCLRFHLKSADSHLKSADANGIVMIFNDGSGRTPHFIIIN